MRLARHLRALRAARGLSQEALADLAALHRTYVGSIERRERNVSLDNIEKLAVALGVDIGELLAPG
jgi:transcriptional regulator with XRE-family HTH domain